MPRELPAIATPVTIEAMRSALRAAWGGPASDEAVELELAHSALETGFWAKMRAFNVGNAKSVPGDGRDFCFFECGEELPLDHARSLAGDPARHVTIKREYVKNGAPMASIVASPSDPICRFRAFDSLAAGVRDHIVMLRTNFPKSWASLQTGDAAAYAAALKAEGYFTDALEHYLDGPPGSGLGLRGVVAQIRKKAPMPDPKLLVPDAKPAFTFEWRAGEAREDRLVRCFEELLADGPVSFEKTPARLRAFVNRKHGDKPVAYIGGRAVQDVGPWHTNCAITVHAAEDWCGLEMQPYVNAETIEQYVEHRRSDHRWVPNDGKNKPTKGAIFYVRPSARLAYDHVGMFGAELSPGVYRTYEGGGGVGTTISKSERDITKPDSYGRVIEGWWIIADSLPLSPPAPELPKPDDDDILPPHPQPPPAREEPRVSDETPTVPDVMPPAPPAPFRKAPLLVFGALILAMLGGGVAGSCSSPAPDAVTVPTPTDAPAALADAGSEQ